MDTLRVDSNPHRDLVSKMGDAQIEKAQTEALERLETLRGGNADFTRAVMGYLMALQLEQEVRTILFGLDAD